MRFIAGEHQRLAVSLFVTFLICLKTQWEIRRKYLFLLPNRLMGRVWRAMWAVQTHLLNHTGGESGSTAPSACSIKRWDNGDNDSKEVTSSPGCESIAVSFQIHDCEWDENIQLAEPTQASLHPMTDWATATTVLQYYYYYNWQMTVYWRTYHWIHMYHRDVYVLRSVLS